jgi:hypothetical protein
MLWVARVPERCWTICLLSNLTPKMDIFRGKGLNQAMLMDSKKRQENQRVSSNPMKTSWGRSSVG